LRQCNALDDHRALCDPTGARHMSGLITRRGLLAGSAAAASALLTGCDRLADAPSFRWLLDLGQSASLHAQRLLLAGQPLVREYTEADISPDFPPNGTEMPR